MDNIRLYNIIDTLIKNYKYMNDLNKLSKLADIIQLLSSGLIILIIISIGLLVWLPFWLMVKIIATLVIFFIPLLVLEAAINKLKEKITKDMS